MAIVELRNSTSVVLRRIEVAGDAAFTEIPAEIAPRTTARWEVSGAGTSTFVLDGADDMLAPRVTLGWMTMLAGTRFFARQSGRQVRVRQGLQPHDNLFTIVMSRTNSIVPVVIMPASPVLDASSPLHRSAQSASVDHPLVTVEPSPPRPRIGMPRHLGLLVPTVIIAIAAILLSGTVTATNIRPSKAIVVTMTPTATAPVAPALSEGRPTLVPTPTVVAQPARQRSQMALVPLVTPIPTHANATPTPATKAHASTPPTVVPPTATSTPPTATPVPPPPTATPISPTATPIPAGSLAVNFTQALASCTNGFFIPVTVTNIGGQPVTWSAAASVNGGKPFVAPRPAGGTLAAGQRAYISSTGQGTAKAVLLTITWTSAGQSHTTQVTYICN